MKTGPKYAVNPKSKKRPKKTVVGQKDYQRLNGRNIDADLDAFFKGISHAKPR